MKKILSVLVLLSFQQALADSWYCTADCGTVNLTLSIPLQALVPTYEGQVVMGEGNSIVRAYQDLRSNCNRILHDGFAVRSLHYIQLNTNVRPERVCRRSY